MAVKEAVQAVLREVRTNADFRTRLHLTPETLAPEQINSEPLKTASLPRFGERLNGAWQRVRADMVRLRAAGEAPLRKLRTWASTTWHGASLRWSAWRRRSEVLRTFRSQRLTALGIGLVVAVVVGYAGPWLAVMVGGIGAFVVTLAVLANLWLRQILATSAEPAG
jgi:hypothetical protein